MPKETFLFIGGTGRSGTTILSRVAGSHKDCSRLPYEFRFHVDPHGLMDLHADLTTNWDVFRGSAAVANFKRFYEKLIAFSFHSYHNVTLKGASKKTYEGYLEEFLADLGIQKDKRLWIGNSPTLPKALSLVNQKMAQPFYPEFFVTKPLDDQTFFKAANSFYHKVFASELKGNEFLVEHTPYNFLHFQFLANVFPEAKFIHIKRFPFDIISSYTTMNWGSTEMEHNAQQIIALYSQWLKKKPSLTNFIEIKLEDLAGNPQETLKFVGDYMGIDPSAFDTSEFSDKKSNVNRWKKHADQFKALHCFDELVQVSEALGYEVTL
ncbi:sulfotransferase family protein [Gilvibacter sp.]|uniref:sulfotransferase family protein n=1 Tax=Gilvibacter sp. TaxID=2729997 RepID=UPI003F49B7BF